jgi:hypothetical protein
MFRFAIVLVVTAALLGQADGAASPVQNPKLFATVAQAPTSTPVTAKTKLVLTTGPSFRITLKTAAGKSFKTMKRGTYTVVVRDRSDFHNAHLTAPGRVNKKTSVPFRGTVTWKVKLAKTGTLRFRCDPHASQMNGSRKIV